MKSLEAYATIVNRNIYKVFITSLALKIQLLTKLKAIDKRLFGDVSIASKLFASSDICVNFCLRQFLKASTDICVNFGMRQQTFASIFVCVNFGMRQ